MGVAFQSKTPLHPRHVPCAQAFQESIMENVMDIMSGGSDYVSGCLSNLMILGSSQCPIKDEEGDDLSHWTKAETMAQSFAGGLNAQQCSKVSEK